MKKKKNRDQFTRKRIEILKKSIKKFGDAHGTKKEEIEKLGGSYGK